MGHIPESFAVDGSWAPVTIDGVTDPDGDPITVTATGVTQDEPVVDVGARPTCPDARIDGGMASVRRERSGMGNGRVYHVAFTASDGRGGSCQGSVAVCVPHDQGRASACVDDGPIYDSMASCAGVPQLSVASVDGLELAATATAGRAWAFDFTLGREDEVTLSVHDVAGRTIATLARSHFAAGAHRLEWKPAGQTPGVYFVRLRTAQTSVVRRFAIL